MHSTIFGVRVWTGFIWLWIRPSGGTLWKWKQTFENWLSYWATFSFWQRTRLHAASSFTWLKRSASVIQQHTKMTAFCDMALCSLVVRRRFAEDCLIALMMEAVRTSETSVYFYETTRRHTLEGCLFVLSAERTWNLTTYGWSAERPRQD
jgi:hypothetical protein